MLETTSANKIAMEVPSPRWTFTMFAAGFCWLMALGGLVFGGTTSIEIFFIFMGTISTIGIFQQRVTVLISDWDVSSSGSHFDAIRFDQIKSIEVKGRRIRLLGNDGIVAFRVRKGDVIRVVQEIERRRAGAIAATNQSLIPGPWSPT